ncbi:hypothetical protein D3C80_1660340 [compost metagenome]
MVLLVAGVLFGACRHGLSVKGVEWQARWSDRDLKGAERNKEQLRQLSMTKVIQGGQKFIGQVVADAVAARSLRSARRRPCSSPLSQSKQRPFLHYRRKPGGYPRRPGAC